jgi:membrane associated rhomboid family serine protease
MILAEPVLLAATDDDDEADSWLVLAALGLRHDVRSARGTFELWVDLADVERASVALAQTRQERASPMAKAYPPIPDHGRSAAGLFMVVVLGAFFYVTSARGADHRAWFDQGAADAARILGGEWWRTITMLTLHADVMHLLGNSVATLIFVGALGRWLGTGLALATTLTAGALGNLLVAVSHGKAHVSVGASTATFGALGLLGGLQLVRWVRGAPGLPGFVRRRQALAVLAACLGIFAMLGVGEKSDVLAHLFGLGVGLLLGATCEPLGRRPLRGATQLALGLASAGVVAGAWLLARR